MESNNFYYKYHKYKHKYHKYKHKYQKKYILSPSYISMLNSIIEQNILSLYEYFKLNFNFDIRTIKSELIVAINLMNKTELINELKDKYNISRYIREYFSKTFKLKAFDKVFDKVFDKTTKSDYNLKIDSVYDKVNTFTTFEGLHNYISNNNSYTNNYEHMLLECQKNNILMDIIRYKSYPQYLLQSDSNEDVLSKISLDAPFVIEPLIL